jgi:hypothetical protein
MELAEIVRRYAQAFSAIDEEADSGRVNQRTGEIYLPGVKSLPETDAVAAIVNWWRDEFPDGGTAPNGHEIGVRYSEIPRAKCDHILTTDGDASAPEWAIEVKNITLIGNNGKRNDFAVSKVLSPFLKDRSLLHDVLRLRTNPPGRRLAAIGYSFDYDADTCKEARRRHPENLAVVSNIEEVCALNGGNLMIEPLMNFATGILQVRNFIAGAPYVEHFDAWKHPCGGRGIVFGWEVRNPTAEGFDPRHPW